MFLLITSAIAAIGFSRGEALVAANWERHPPRLDLSLTKQVSQRPSGGFKVGDQVVYTLTTRNASVCKNEDDEDAECASANNVLVRDVLPSGLTFVRANPGAAYNPATGLWSVKKLHAGESDTLQIVATINRDAGRSITNYAQVWRATPDDVDSTPGNNSTNEDDDASVTIDVGVVHSSIAGNVYLDVNDNGARDQNEAGIGDVRITLRGVERQGNAVTRTTNTQSNGTYIFADLNPGVYRVSETQPDDFADGKDSVGSAGGTLGDDQIGDINLGSGVAAVNYNFGERPIIRSSIAGNVYVDANDNGVRDSGESGIGGVRITLAGTDGQGGSVSRGANTQSDGTYIFTNLPSGTYRVAESQPQGFLDGKDAVGSAGGTLGNDVISNIPLRNNTAAVGYNFGERTGAIDLAIAKSHTGNFTAGANGVYTLTVTNVGSLRTTDEIKVVDILPSGLSFVSGTGDGWNCNDDNQRVSCERSRSLSPGEATHITLTVSVATRIVSQVVNVATVSTRGDGNTDNNTARDRTNIIHPTPPPPDPEPCDTGGASVLLFPLYASDSVNTRRENTRITLTNTNQDSSVSVHLFFVDGAKCTASDASVCLTKNQTVSFLTSEMDPGTTGYLLAVAVNNEGCPISFNHLVGQADVKLASGHTGSYLADKFQALYRGTLPGCDSNSSAAVVSLDGVLYTQAASQLAVPMIASLANGNKPLLALVRTGGDLRSGAFPLGSVFGVLYDDQENPFSFSISSRSCQLKEALTEEFPRTAPRLPTVIPSGHTGWMRLGTNSNDGIAGVFFNTNTNQDNIGSVFNVGVLLPKLRCGADSYTIPVFPPVCR